MQDKEKEEQLAVNGSPRKRFDWLPWFAAVVILSGLVRVVVLTITDPVVTRDSIGYLEVADAIAHLDFSGYNGARTPVFPLFLALVDSDTRAVVITQACLGVLSTIGLFLLAWLLTRSAPASTLVAAASGVNLSQIRFETLIQPETLSTFFLVTGIVAFAGTVFGPTRGKHALLVVCGISTAAAALARPLLAVVPVALAVSLMFMKGMRRKSAFFLIPAIAPILGWCIFLEARFGYFGITTLTGFSLTNHSGGFIEYAPDEFAAIRDPYLEVRKARGGDHRDVIFSVIGRIESQTGKPYHEISKDAEKMSLGLFVRYPFRYVQSVIWSWIEFMDARGSREWLGSRSENAGRILANVVWRAQWYVLIAMNVLFLVLTPLYYVRRMRTSLSESELLIGGIALVVLLAQLVQALVEWGHNARYGVPFQPLTATIVVVLAIWTWGVEKKKRMTVFLNRGEHS